jgi:uronate dehydrogenase
MALAMRRRSLVVGFEFIDGLQEAMSIDYACGRWFHSSPHAKITREFWEYPGMTVTIGRVLLTGAGGKIGTVLREGLKGRYPVLRLSHRRPFGEAAAGEEIALADLEVLDQVVAAMEGVDVVVHMGGRGEEGDWPTVLTSNILGTYNVFEAARLCRVRRVVFASSNHVVGYYRRERRIGPDEPVRPDTRYGVSKAFGEALGRYYADKFGLGVICQRIGCFYPKPLDTRMLSEWISVRDMVELTRCCIEAADIHFEIVYGVSANTRIWWDNPAAARIGYVPQDNAEAFAGEVPAEQPGVECLFQGGRYTGLEFAGDPAEIR